MARIRTRFGTLCCEPLPNQPWALQCAWVGVTNPTGPTAATFVWAQTGYQKWRHNGVIRSARFWEVNGSTYNKTLTAAPAQNSTHTYACELIAPAPTGNAVWQFRFNGVNWGQYTDPNWTGFGHFGNRADYTGEIHNFEDDMPGSSAPPAANTCLFTNCQYRKFNATTLIPGPWQPAGLVAADVRSRNPAKWGARFISATSFEIWDVARG
jgi:hypothetical protein